MAVFSVAVLSVVYFPWLRCVRLCFLLAALSVAVLPGYDVYGCVFCGCIVCRSVSLATTCMALFSVAALSVAVPPWLRRVWLCFL